MCCVVLIMEIFWRKTKMTENSRRDDGEGKKKEGEKTEIRNVKAILHYLPGKF